MCVGSCHVAQSLPVMVENVLSSLPGLGYLPEPWFPNLRDMDSLPALQACMDAALCSRKPLCKQSCTRFWTDPVGPEGIYGT